MRKPLFPLARDEIMTFNEPLLITMTSFRVLELSMLLFDIGQWEMEKNWLGYYRSEKHIVVHYVPSYQILNF